MSGNETRDNDMGNPRQAESMQANSTYNYSPVKQRYFNKEAILPSIHRNGLKSDHKPIPLGQNKASSSELLQLNDSFEPRIRVALDGFLLLEMAGMQFPDDARQVICVNRNIGAVVDEDLAFFTGLLFLDLSENFLSLESFSSLPRLKEIRLACNNISTIPQLSGFPKLIAVDLSFNKLDAQSVSMLSTIPHLKDLGINFLQFIETKSQFLT